MITLQNENVFEKPVPMRPEQTKRHLATNDVQYRLITCELITCLQTSPGHIFNQMSAAMFSVQQNTIYKGSELLALHKQDTA